MEKIAILTDSSCDLPEEIIKKFCINVLPLHIIYDNKVFKDKIDITAEEIYEKMPQQIPKTSMPSVGEALDTITNLKKNGYTHVLAITLSSGLSGTFSMIESIREKIEKLNITLAVIDSKALSLGLGFLVLKAAELIQEQLPFQEIVDKTKELQKEARVFFVLKTLEYLRKGGRIGLVEGAIGDILDIKPIISINEEGIYYSAAKTRGRNRSLNKIMEVAKEAIGNRKVYLGILHGNAEEEANMVMEKLKKELDYEYLFISQITSSLGVHTGPGLIGITFCPA